MVTHHHPKGLLRIALRLPIWLYHLHLGWLLGHRFLMLTHRGRKSGLSRQTVVEVVTYDQVTSTYIIASGWGEKSDWFRNVQKTPQVSVNVAGRQFQAEAQILSIAQAAEALAHYAQQHPTSFRQLSKTVTGQALEPNAAGFDKLAAQIPLVALHPLLKTDTPVSDLADGESFHDVSESVI